MGWRDRARRYRILIGLNVMSCYVMLCHVMSCYVMLCHVMSCFLGDKNTCLESVTLFIDATLMTDVIL